jgi:alpha-tubulin suppressor-like RCC1 family protein
VSDPTDEPADAVPDAPIDQESEEVVSDTDAQLDGPDASDACLSTCPTGACGSVSDRCGGTLPCGTCGAGRCISNTCVTLTDISSGGSHTCGVGSDGVVRCWGSNSNGQLGDGSGIDSNSAIRVALLGGAKATHVAAGYEHTCALVDDGSVQCWGANLNGAIGDGTKTDRPTPVRVTGLTTPIQQLAAGHDHTCALAKGGTVWCWGGLPSTLATTPTAIAGFGSNIASIAAGGFHDCAVTKDGAVMCWGDDTYGQLGDAATTYQTAPKSIAALSANVKALAAGKYHTCALMNDTSLQCWGFNANGQVGDGTSGTGTDRGTPTTVLAPVGTVAAGYFHTCALESDHGLFCWGAGGAGQLGDGASTGSQATPERITSFGTTVRQLALGALHSCAIMGDGNAKCWGAGTNGQLGNGASSDSPVPVSVAW